MRADPRFVDLSKAFWANVRSISQQAGYTKRDSRQVKVHTVAEMAAAMTALGLRVTHITGRDGATELGRRLEEYFAYRAEVLNAVVAPQLMDAPEAEQVFEELRARLDPRCPLPMNKQKGEKARPAFLTGIVNMLVEANCDGLPVDYDPRELTTFTRDDQPLRTLA
ncbi:MAG TPA: hypothetical protein VGA37_12575, partial [Gemmatimonadales bacterium]